MQNEASDKPKTSDIKVLIPKKILIKKAGTAASQKTRKVFESLDIPLALLLKKDNKNNSSSNNID